MNRIRRKSLRTILGQMDELSTVLETVKEALQDVLNEEQEAYDNLPEGLQESDRGQQMQEYIDALEGVVDSLGELDIEDLYGTIEEIAEG
ncbi:hypothetical protein [Flavonifractor porci]|jgi:hypothetical protein|uniref:hypothetical protein n=1 Tax=Flavonifractor porci TaxID=3133422 RepID=UPI00309685A1